MPATKCRRIAETDTLASRDEAVRDMLREMAYVLHVTRKISRDISWPVAAPATETAPTPADAAPMAAAAV